MSRNTSEINEFKKLSISLPPELMEKIDAMARRENRSRSNMIAQLCQAEINHIPAPAEDALQYEARGTAADTSHLTHEPIKPKSGEKVKAGK